MFFVALCILLSMAPKQGHVAQVQADEVAPSSLSAVVMILLPLGVALQLF
jgi:hypothetical protein